MKTMIGYNAQQEAEERAKVLEQVRNTFPITNNCTYDLTTYNRLLQTKNATPYDSAPRMRYHAAYDQLIMEYQNYLALSCKQDAGGNVVPVLVPDEESGTGESGDIMTWITANPVLSAGIAVGVALILYKLSQTRASGKRRRK